jgi:DNA repair photolyase
MRFLKPADLPDNFTRSLYKIAPYRGCGHGCRYCDGRAERYYVEGDFEKDIVVRDDIPELLAADLPKVRERGFVAFGSGTTDPYQPLEATRNITGRCAELLAARAEAAADRAPAEDTPFALPAMVMTKSALALRDLPLWRKVNEASGFLLLVSITSLDEELRRTMEPGASSFAERLALLKSFKEAGCAVGVLAMPFLPGLSDAEESIRALYEAISAIGVDFVMPGGLTLRPGRQKDFYLKALASYRPDLLGPTEALFSNEKESGAPWASATHSLRARLACVSRDFDLPWLLPHAIYSRILPTHDSLRLLFRDMIELYGARGVDTRALRSSADRYDAWLVEQRRAFRRRRNESYRVLEEALPRAEASGELAKVLDNPKLSHFVSAILRESAVFDYRSLRLVEQKTSH